MTQRSINALTLAIMLCMTNGYAHTTQTSTENASEAHDHSGHDHEEHNHDDHAGHDHEEHNHDDHAGHDHEEHNHDDHAGHNHAENTHDEGIEYSKQQQLQAHLKIQPVQKRRLKESVATFSTVDIPVNAQYRLVAPVAGILTIESSLHIGTTVNTSQTVAVITPLLGQKEDLSTLKLELKKAQADLQLATQENKRLQQLKKDNAVSTKRLNIAAREYAMAQARLVTVKQRLKQLDSHSSNPLGVVLKTPLYGTVIRQQALSGSFVNEGDPIMQIANTDSLWITTAIAQSDIAKVSDPLGVELLLNKNYVDFSVGNNATFLYFSKMIDPKTRCASIVFEVKNTHAALVAGARFASKVYTGKRIEAVAIPQSAVVNDNGQHVVYVQVGEERFERRNIKTGLHDAGYVEVISGVTEGERIVSAGAYDLLLAALIPADVGHGHAH